MRDFPRELLIKFFKQACFKNGLLLCGRNEYNNFALAFADVMAMRPFEVQPGNNHDVPLLRSMENVQPRNRTKKLTSYLTSLIGEKDQSAYGKHKVIWVRFT